MTASTCSTLPPAIREGKTPPGLPLQQSQEGKLAGRQQTTASGCAVTRLQLASTGQEYLRRGVITGGARTCGAREDDWPNWWGPPCGDGSACGRPSQRRGPGLPQLQQQGPGLLRQQDDPAQHQPRGRRRREAQEQRQLRRQRVPRQPLHPPGMVAEAEWGAAARCGLVSHDRGAQGGGTGAQEGAAGAQGEAARRQATALRPDPPLLPALGR